MKIKITTILVIAVLFSSCGILKQSQNTANKAPEKTPVEVWNLELSSVKTAPVIHNGVAYIISGRTVYSVDIKTHQQKWKYSISFGETIKQKCVIHDNIVLVTCDKMVYGVDIETGKYIWTKTGGKYDGIYSVSPIAAANGLMFYWKPNSQMKGDKFCAADIKTGELKWEIDARTNNWSKPAVNDSIIVMRRTYGDWINQNEKGQFNYLTAYDINTGKELWNKVYSEYIAEAPVVKDPIIDKKNIIIEVDEHLECLNMNGDKIWSFDFDKTSKYSRGIENKIENGKIIIENGKTYTLNLQDGNLLWKTDAFPYKNKQYATSSNLLLIQTDKTTIKAFDMSNGSEKWIFKDPNAEKLFLSSEIVDETIFVNYYRKKMSVLK